MSHPKYNIMVGNRFYQAESAAEAIDTLCHSMSCNRQEVEEQMARCQEASQTYGFVTGHIYISPVWRKQQQFIYDDRECNDDE